MSFTTGLIKKAVKWTPKGMVLWVANKRLTGVARLVDYGVDFDSRKAHVLTVLHGEPEPLEVKLEGFSIIPDGDSYKFLLQHAESNKPWLTNALAYVTGKAWPIPAIPPKFAKHFPVVAELFKPQPPTGA
jgi:hypothetical protein